MNLEAFIKQLKQEGIEHFLDEPMKNHTSFGIGGKADVFITVTSEKELVTVLGAAKYFEVPYFILGNGSNLLVSDKGIEGAVIKLWFNSISVDNNTITCGASTKLTALCLFAENEGLSGLEFAYGIPGTVGGAIYMNAGAYGGEMKDVVVSAECVDEWGKKITLSKFRMNLGYRTSAFKENGLIITSVTFKLEQDGKNAIRARMDDYMSRRRDKQPLDMKSAGSTFKRPEGNFAGTLIEQCELKGLSCGDAQVSTKHAGFIVNCGKAKCRDVKKLIATVQKTVFEKTGVSLEPEVIFVGRE